MMSLSFRKYNKLINLQYPQFHHLVIAWFQFHFF